MVVLKSSKAIGTFLGLGTHVWLEINAEDGTKTTFSGSKIGSLLGAIKNYKRDFDKPAHRGFIEILAPEGVCDSDWDAAIIEAGDKIIEIWHKKLPFSGAFPDHVVKGNCCTIVNAIIKDAGGCIPRKRLWGFAPGMNVLRCDW